MRRGQLLEQLRYFATLEELRSSAFYSANSAEIEDPLAAPEVVRSPDAEPLLRDFVRVACWNLEQGRSFSRILRTLQQSEVLRWADILLLNEADVGMRRSGNRHVALELARALRMHMCFGAAHIELTGGSSADPDGWRDNTESLQGNAVLSRYPISRALVSRLPVCFEPYHFAEKRYGGRNCVWAAVELGGKTAWVGAVHLEVRDTPRCRARQVRALMSDLPGLDGDLHLIGGDLNTSGLGRGTRLRTLVSSWKLAACGASTVRERLCHPERGSEPLFNEVRAAGFDWVGLNGEHPTAGAPLHGMEDSAFLPPVLRRLILWRLSGFNGCLPLKLDWFLGRDVRGLGEGEIRDARTGTISRQASRVPVVLLGPDRISDHCPIFVDMELPR